MTPHTLDSVASWVADLTVVTLFLSPATVAHPRVPHPSIDAITLLTLGTVLVVVGLSIRVFACHPYRPTLHQFGWSTLMSGAISLIIGLASLNGLPPYQLVLALPVVIIVIAWVNATTDRDEPPTSPS